MTVPPNPTPDSQPAAESTGYHTASTENADRPHEPNWYARFALAAPFIAMIVGRFAPAGVATGLMGASLAMAILALKSKKAPNTEHWMAWAAIGIFVLQVVATIILIATGY